ncbi:hypothetical protein SAY87_011431 [Trapa incisa]|uniref:Protein kinase domain-containing protein n=1 Tax=Trapa incisa TaxID=236973 RepID=A0AAN7JIA9_9MYRT|nr:hypothetical protein SAY87_011431 [Trapa incisa]
MGLRILALFLGIILGLSATGGSDDSGALQAIKMSLNNMPPNWVGFDPCSEQWEGIRCTNSRVTFITLSSIGLSGQLTGDIGSLTELQTLDLSYNKGLKGALPDAIGNLRKLTNLILVGCGFTGSIPSSIGLLQELVFLSLNSNGFTGPIPPSIGNLTNLYWLDLADNQLTGSIPVSNGSTPGLDLLLNTKHFHLGNNRLTGTVPGKLLSSEMKLIHLLLDNNQLTGSLPSTVGLVQTLEAVRLDGNSFSGPLPTNLNNLTKVQELFLSNNKFTGPLPNLTGLNYLSYLDMSNNSFDASDFPTWITTLQSLTSLMLERTQVQGLVPTSLFNLANLQTVILRNNALNGTLNIGSSFSSQLQLVDLYMNKIDAYTENVVRYSNKLILAGNPICQQSGADAQSYCKISQSNSSSYSTPSNNCIPMLCSIVNQISSPNCKCSFPYTGTLVFRSPSFSNLENTTYYVSLASSLMVAFNKYQLPVDSVSLGNPHKDSINYLKMTLQIFPSEGDRFNRTGIYSLGFVLSNQTYKPPPQFGPFYFMGDQYEEFSAQVPQEPGKSSSSLNTGVIAGAAAGGSVLLLLLVLAGMYALRQKKNADKAAEMSNAFGKWDSTENSGGIPQLKGARWFSFDELRKITNNFSESNDIGSGGYGKVYRGTLPSGQLVAVKRAQQGSMQGGVEFKNEIELLSRVHHKNLVDLVGFCFEQGEQILVYEYIPNGTIKESLSERGKYIVREIKIAMDRSKELYGLQVILDPVLVSSGTQLRGLEKFIDIAMRCVAESGSDRPTMGEVVKEIETVMQSAGLNPNAESASTSATYGEDSRGNIRHPYMEDTSFDHSGAFPPSRVEPQ